jgi:hypothetical protein
MLKLKVERINFIEATAAIQAVRDQLGVMLAINPESSGPAASLVVELDPEFLCQEFGLKLPAPAQYGTEIEPTVDLQDLIRTLTLLALLGRAQRTPLGSLRGKSITRTHDKLALDVARVCRAAVEAERARAPLPPMEADLGIWLLEEALGGAHA